MVGALLPFNSEKLADTAACRTDQQRGKQFTQLFFVQIAHQLAFASQGNDTVFFGNNNANAIGNLADTDSGTVARPQSGSYIRVIG
ncbi:hypothetical protein SDC9_184705 [bioreactor metagenome]|uniref:Uncharacterized protein n=1 Tax=bioreactor metagenome TaxID=1076179 RepID=A0A645HG89_9ZZZZ